MNEKAKAILIECLADTMSKQVSVCPSSKGLNDTCESHECFECWQIALTEVFKNE